jgi:hypothetical protein
MAVEGKTLRIPANGSKAVVLTNGVVVLLRSFFEKKYIVDW